MAERTTIRRGRARPVAVVLSGAHDTPNAAFVQLNDLVPIPYTMRSTQKMFVDLAPVIASFHDSNTVTVRVVSPGGKLKACPWLCAAITDGMTRIHVNRDLLDNFWLETVAATDGAVAGDVLITGNTGANGSGSTVTKVLRVTVDNYPRMFAWAFGAKTLPAFGGVPLHDLLPGDPSQWSISTQTHESPTKKQFEIISDAGRGLYRLVLKGTLYKGLFSEAVPAGSSGFDFPPTANETVSVVLTHGQGAYPDRTVQLTFTPDQFDVAPWPARDFPNNMGGISSVNGNQAVIFWSHYSPKSVGLTCVMEDGVYPIDMTNTNVNLRGVATVFNATGNMGSFPPTGQPTAPYAGNSWSYQGYLQASSGWITMRARSPLGAVWNGDLRLNVQNIDRTTNQALGFRLSNLKVEGVCRVYDASGGNPPIFRMMMVDHGDFGSVLFNVANFRHNEIFLVANRFRGAVQLVGDDCQLMGNLFDDIHMYVAGCDQKSVVTGTINGTALHVSDASAAIRPLAPETAIFGPGVTSGTRVTVGSGYVGDYTVNVSSSVLTDTAFSTFPAQIDRSASDQLHWCVRSGAGSSLRARRGFNTFLSGKVIDPLHADLSQMDGVGLTRGDAELWIQYGEVIHPGTPYVYTANDLKGVADPTIVGKTASQGQNFFQHDIGSATSIVADTVGCLVVSIDQHGFDYDQAGNGLTVKNNMMLYPPGVSNPVNLAPPWVNFRVNPATPQATISGTTLHVSSIPNNTRRIFVEDYVYGTSITVGTQILTAPAGGGVGDYTISISHNISQPQAMFMTYYDGAANNTVTVADNILSVTGILNGGGGPMNATVVGDATNNKFGADATWQATNLTQPGIGTAVVDRSDVIRAFAPKAGASSDATTKGPFFDKTKIDLWRQTVDDTWLVS